MREALAGGDARRARLAQIKERRLASMAKAREAGALKRKQRALVLEKLEANLPITEEERALIPEPCSGRGTLEEQKRNLLARAAQLVIKPQNVSELRLLVEETVRKSKYNPIESLIDLANEDDTPTAKKIEIHKALLPFIVPQLPPMEKEKKESEGAGVRVTITNFVFPAGHNQRPAVPLHEQRPVTVETTVTESSE